MGIDAEKSPICRLPAGDPGQPGVDLRVQGGRPGPRHNSGQAGRAKPLLLYLYVLLENAYVHSSLFPPRGMGQRIYRELPVDMYKCYRIMVSNFISLLVMKLGIFFFFHLKLILNDYVLKYCSFTGLH